MLFLRITAVKSLRIRGLQNSSARTSESKLRGVFPIWCHCIQSLQLACPWCSKKAYILKYLLDFKNNLINIGCATLYHLSMTYITLYLQTAHSVSLWWKLPLHPFYFIPYFNLFNYLYIRLFYTHSFIHSIHLVFYTLLTFYVYFTTPSMCITFYVLSRVNIKCI